MLAHVHEHILGYWEYIPIKIITFIQQNSVQQRSVQRRSAEKIRPPQTGICIYITRHKKISLHNYPSTPIFRRENNYWQCATIEVVSIIRCPMPPTLRWEGVEDRCSTHRVGLMQFFVAQQAEFLAGVTIRTKFHGVKKIG